MYTLEYKDCTVWKNTAFKVHRVLTVSEEETTIDFKGEILKQPKYKFKEIVEFESTKKPDKKAICIGYNPALAIKEIDTSNKRLIITLEKNDYTGYVLFNLYPEVTAHKESINISDNQTVFSLNKLKEEISNFQYRDLVLFFGRSTNLTTEQVDFIKELASNKHIMLTTFDGEFIHPGSIGSVELIDFQPGFIREDLTHQIRIKQ